MIDLVDEIAYNTADLDDGFEAHLVDLELLCGEVPLFGAAHAVVDREYPQGVRKLKFNEALKRVLDRLATDLIETTRDAAEASGVETVEEVRRLPRRLAGFSQELAQQVAGLKRFLFARVYSQPAIAEDRDRSVASLDALFRFFMEHPETMPEHYAQQATQQARHRVVCDYIAGMTDHFLLRQCQEFLGVPAARRG